MRIGFIQNYPKLGEKNRNLERVLSQIEKTEADLLVLPELFASGYFFSSLKELALMAEEIPDGFTVRIFRALARKRKTAFVFGMAEKKGSKFYNSAVYVSPQGRIGLYRKIHLFYKEPVLFAPGNLQPICLRFYEYKLGIMICFDYMFPELCRVLALKGADLICHPSNLVLHYCQTVMRARSIENRIFTITANRVGCESAAGESLRFIGASQITDVHGHVLLRAGRSRPEVGVVDLPLHEARDKRPTNRNHLFHDRRTRFYRPLLQKSIRRI